MRTALSGLAAVAVLAVSGTAWAQAPVVSQVVAGTAAVGEDGTVACVIVVSSEDDDWIYGSKHADGGSIVLRGCVLATADEAGALYAEPALGKCAPEQEASWLVVSAQDDDWIGRTGAKLSGACLLVLTPDEGAKEPGLYEAIGIDGARVYILDEDDRIE